LPFFLGVRRSGIYFCYVSHAQIGLGARHVGRVMCRN
jgi:hypothetical protein